MTKALIKNTMRDIWQTKARFISIFAIISLGVGFFAGVKATSPSMINMAQTYFESSNLADLHILSTVGFDEDDVDAVSKIDGVTSVMPSYFTDVILDSENSDSVVHLMATPSEYNGGKSLNDVTVVDGKLPQKSGEIAVECGSFSSYKIGEKIKISPTIDKKDTKYVLNTLEYTVVGLIKSPQYISFERGTTTVGNGRISAFMMICKEDFNSKKFTELYVKTKYSNDGISPFSDEYKNGIDNISDKIKTVEANRINVFKTDVLDTAQQELNDNVKKYNTEKANAQKELDKAKADLDKGQNDYDTKIAEGQKQLDDAQQKITSGEAQLEKAKTEYQNKITSGESEIAAAEKKITSGKAELQKAQKEYDDKISSAQEKLDAATEEYNTAYLYFYDEVKPQAEQKITIAQTLIDVIQPVIKSLREQLEGTSSSATDKIKEQLDTWLNKLSDTQKQLDDAKKQLTDGEKQLMESSEKLQSAKAQFEAQKAIGAAKLESAQQELNDGEKQLTDAKIQLANGKAEGQKQISDAEVKLANGKLELEQAKKTFEEQKTAGITKLADGRKQYEKASKQANDKFKEAKRKLDDAQNELNKLSSPQWYKFTRDDNPGYSSFIDNTNSVDAVSTVFPLFFMLVATLVCLTTMTRLIEEKRTEIGTLKALGYKSKSIVSKFLIYATSAGVLGSIAGILLGIYTLPFIIYDAYKIMYTMPNITLCVDWFSIILGFVAALLCTSIVSVIVCYRTLHNRPAKLMRPKAPKAGKRILLERIPFIWNKLSFTSKVTCRNLMRYKIRFLMTVIGVAGCTALIVSAFGLLDSISSIVDKQFNQISIYNTIIVPAQSGDETDLKELNSFIDSDARISASMNCIQTAIKVSSKKDSDANSIYLFVPQDANNLKSLIDLHNRQTKEKLELTSDGVIITEKLANTLGVSKDDEITVNDNGKSYNVKVTGISENYMYGYVYMTSQMYKNIYNISPDYNLVLAKADNISDSLEKQIGNDYLKRNDITTVSFLSAGVDEFQNTVSSLNLVVLVMIICAGALAFVVLYNLTNINIAERMREIATIKVLGFYNKETAAYIYRENIVLTIFGIIGGLFLGTILWMFIIVTVEINAVMFGRDIFWQSYLYAAGLTMLFSLVVNAIMYYKIKKVNMVESLKSIE